jgi:hypothetical protein
MKSKHSFLTVLEAKVAGLKFAVSVRAFKLCHPIAEGGKARGHEKKNGGGC